MLLMLFFFFLSSCLLCLCYAWSYYIRIVWHFVLYWRFSMHGMYAVIRSLDLSCVCSCDKLQRLVIRLYCIVCCQFEFTASFYMVNCLKFHLNKEILLECITDCLVKIHCYRKTYTANSYDVRQDNFHVNILLIILIIIIFEILFSTIYLWQILVYNIILKIFQI